MRRTARVAIIGVAGLLAAQQMPTFEVATVKSAPAVGDRGTNINTSGRTLTIHNGTLKFCIQAAYSVGVDRIFGGPSWTGTDKFEVTGKSEKPVPAGQLLQMLRSLLAERFQLKVHSEQREVPIYVMVLAKGGSKLKQTDPNDTEPPSLLGRRGGLAGHKTTMGDLAATLALPASLGRPVVDRTGLNGVYNFSLEGFAPLTGGADDTRPSFFTAIEEQLGIKLEATKGPVEVLVIDQAARPSEN